MRYVFQGAALLCIGAFLSGCAADNSKEVASKQVIVKAPGMS